MLLLFEPSFSCIIVIFYLKILFWQSGSLPTKRKITQKLDLELKLVFASCFFPKHSLLFCYKPFKPKKDRDIHEKEIVRDIQGFDFNIFVSIKPAQQRA